MANAIHIQKAINYFHEASSEAEKIKAARYFVEVMAETMGISIDHAIEKAKDVIASKVPGEEKYVDYAFMEQAEISQQKKQPPVVQPISAVKKPKEIKKPRLEDALSQPDLNNVRGALKYVRLRDRMTEQDRIRQSAATPTQVASDDTLAVLGSVVIVGGIVWWLATR